ncbi:hypothetical protein SH601_04955 [Gracilibacillus sp. S3-1-1]|uniref:Uncharacterized protein n=1 Tax=Gracilibacillus pellucidus TaxID=3095368 RepID=A0ACC6M3A7_9BACI|nr:hypothetical protein [Gracilibacillus sp. S3-1-1]MDX8045332.1 hypothetical protein [Gracilibacillus sp. S3-1-1]
MVKNLPLLIAMFTIGCGVTLISSRTALPQVMEIVLLSIGAILKVWSIIGLILHLGIIQWNKDFND